jgi:putative transposase
MKRSKFSDSQIIDAVKRVESGIGVPDICRELGVSSATFYKWRSKYGGMDVFMMSRMKELEEENRRLKKMYLEENLQAEIVSEALEKKSGEAKKVVADRGVCIRVACVAFRISESCYRYERKLDAENNEGGHLADPIDR